MKIVSNASNLMVKGSLASIAKADHKSIAESFLNVDKVILIDASGSMAATDATEGQSRWKCALNQLARLQSSQPGKIAVLPFSSSVEFAPTGIPNFLGEGTDVAMALMFIRPIDGLDIDIVLISDGEPNDASAALAIAGKFKSKIYTIFIGPSGFDGAMGREFLRQLAVVSGGKSVSQDLQELHFLSETVIKLLTKGGDGR
jgi:Mg-chelatase subunit ChlD